MAVVGAPAPPLWRVLLWHGHCDDRRGALALLRAGRVRVDGEPARAHALPVRVGAEVCVCGCAPCGPCGAAGAHGGADATTLDTTTLGASPSDTTTTRMAQSASHHGRPVDAEVCACGAHADARVGATSTTRVLSRGHRYILLHKPAGTLTHAQTSYTKGGATVPDSRPCAVDLVRAWCASRWPPPPTPPPTPREIGWAARGLMHVGRLDVDTTGALLFTTDGVLCHGLLGPGSGHAEKTYLATLRGGPKGLDAEGIARLKRGVRLPGKRQRTVHGRAMNVGTVRHAPRTESVWVGGGQRRVQGGGVRGGESDEDRSRPGGGEQMRQQEFRESAVVELTAANSEPARFQQQVDSNGVAPRQSLLPAAAAALETVKPR